MKQTARIISTYTADVSGVASALFELGGMTVIHDASGCNSTYNTHDEPRWYNQDSLVFISALMAIDATTGNDDKLINDIFDAANDLQPKFVAIAGTPIPMLIGTDLAAIARRVESVTKIPAFGLDTNSMHSYQNGVSKAWTALAKRFVPPASRRQKGARSVNIIGLTPLDYSVNGSAGSIRQWLTENGFTVAGCWAMDSSLDQLEQSGNADVSLVTAYDGLATAEYIYQTCGVPYVIGSPLGYSFASYLIDCLNQSSADGLCRNALSNRGQKHKDAVLIGESVYNASLAWSIEKECGIGCRLIVPLETDLKLLDEADAAAADEDEIIPLLKDSPVIIADPLYQPICPPASRFYRLASEAFSGRLYRNEIPNLIAKKLKRG